MKLSHQKVRAILTKTGFKVGHYVTNIGMVRGMETLIGGNIALTQLNESVIIDIQERSCYPYPNKKDMKASFLKYNIIFKPYAGNWSYIVYYKD
jgi:hypothetical protein